jgi:hypothetical protein
MSCADVLLDLVEDIVTVTSWGNRGSCVLLVSLFVVWDL